MAPNHQRPLHTPTPPPSPQPLPGYIFNFQLYTQNNFGQLLLIFFLFQLAMTSVAVFASPFARKATVAIYVGFITFILGWIMQFVILADLIYTPQYINSAATRIFTLFPWSVFSKGLADLGASADRSQGELKLIYVS